MLLLLVSSRSGPRRRLSRATMSHALWPGVALQVSHTHQVCACEHTFRMEAECCKKSTKNPTFRTGNASQHTIPKEDEQSTGALLLMRLRPPFPSRAPGKHCGQDGPHSPKVVPASGRLTDDTMTKPKPSLSPRRMSTS